MVRLKHRYLLVNVLYPEDGKNARVSTAENAPLALQFRRPSDDRVDARMLARLVRDGVAELFGDYGSGMIASSLQVKYFSPATSTAIIRVARDHYRLVWSALAFTTHLPKPVDQPCVMQVARVSGTIKKAEEEAIRRARIAIRRAQKSSRPGAGTMQDPPSVRESEEVGLGEDGDLDMGFADGIEDQDEPGDLDEESE